MATEKGVRVAITRAIDGAVAALRGLDDPIVCMQGLHAAQSNLNAAMQMAVRIPASQWGVQQERCDSCGSEIPDGEECAGGC